MSEVVNRPIWNPDTGIMDLPADTDALSASEIPGIKATWTDQRERLKETTELSDFTERMNREWAIETGVIENLYDIERGVTQTLIESGFRVDLLSHGSTNRPREYVIRLLQDQKDALEGIFDFVKGDRSLSVSYVKELHAALLRSQNTTEGVDQFGRHVDVPLIVGEWKKQPNSPVRDGVTYTYCPPEHVASEMDRLIALHTRHVEENVSSEVQAAWLHHRFTQIHPFQDGNGRVARALASLVLVRDGLFPLVVTRSDKTKYLDALERADNGDLGPLIALIARLQRDQFRKATAISEAILAEEPEEKVRVALDGLHRAAERVAADRRAAWKNIFERANAIEGNLEERLAQVRQEVAGALERVSQESSVWVRKSSSDNDHYYRNQIIENARNHLDYFADLSEYRSWVSLNMRWMRRAQLVFAIHGIGRPFNGSLICAPFLEFKDRDEEDDQTRATFVPVAEEGFVFFYNESEERLKARFAPWRENVLTVALGELAQNL